MPALHYPPFLSCWRGSSRPRTTSGPGSGGLFRQIQLAPTLIPLAQTFLQELQWSSHENSQGPPYRRISRCPASRIRTGTIGHLQLIFRDGKLQLRHARLLSGRKHLQRLFPFQRNPFVLFPTGQSPCPFARRHHIVSGFSKFVRVNKQYHQDHHPLRPRHGVLQLYHRLPVGGARQDCEHAILQISSVSRER